MDFAVVIPCYRVRRHILGVIAGIGPEWSRIFVVDDACPEGSGASCRTPADPRVQVLFHPANKGVGGAMIAGYRAALGDGARFIVKLDGDGQMDPACCRCWWRRGRARPTTPRGTASTPGPCPHDAPLRLVGNAVLSFMTKLSAGYWNIFDPTNGYTAIHGRRRLAGWS